jgi:hypothetical protein
VQSLSDHWAIATQTLCNRCAIAAPSLRYHSTIAVQSLSSRCAITVQLLCNR